MFTLLILVCQCLLSVDAHGYLFEPVARSSAWLVDDSFKACCTYPGHMEMFCGGVGHQWNSNGGKCGICGEPYDRAQKLFEKGGRMYTGKTVQVYNQGQEIDVKVKLSANHQGYFEFRLCNVDSTAEADATQECLDRQLLTIVTSNSTKFRDVVKFASEMITIRLQLPPEIFCQHCVFQWRYTTGNNWGRDPSTNKSGPGLGRENETFMGCADITILNNRPPTLPPPLRIYKTTRTTRKTSKLSTSKPPHQWPISAILLETIARIVAARLTQHSSVLPTTVSTTTSTSTTQAPRAARNWSGLLAAYEKGDQVMLNGITYSCVTAHRSYAGAEPGPLTWALWRKLD